jgi:hypothetical protein
MAKFVFLDCRCGRTLRAWDHQAGETIQCWGCREKTTVPLPNVLGRLPGEMWQSVLDIRREGRLAVCVAAAVVTTGALMLGQAGLLVVGIAIVAAAVAFRDRLAHGLRLGLEAVSRHPLRTLGAVLMLPIALVAIEAGLVGLSYQQNWLRYMTLDVSPRAGAVAVLGIREDTGSTDLALISDAEVFSVYRYGLRRGFALTWTVPASLMRGTTPRTDTGYAFVNQIGWSEWVNPVQYLAFKAACSIGALSSLFLLVSLGGQWVVRIATVGARQPAPQTSPPSPMTWTMPQATSAPASWTGIPAGVGRS